MSQQFEINAESRHELGKGVARRMRKNDVIPAVVYGAKQEPQSLTLSHKEIFYTLENEAAYSQVIDLKVDGKTEKVVIKDIQRHPYKPKITHVDFLRVSAKDAIIMHVPLHFTGEDIAAGIKSGGVITKMMTEVEVRCLPANLPEFIELDVTELALDQTFHLSDLTLPKGVELTAQVDEEHNDSIISISKPKSVAEPEQEADADAADADAEASKE